MAKKERLSKKLTLFDVYAVSTGAMFSSGFFYYQVLQQWKQVIVCI